VASLRALNWKSGLAAAALVLAVGGLCELAADDECNHLVGDIVVAERGTPRGAWCGAVQWDQRWLAVLLVPAALTLLLVLVAGARRSVRIAACGIGLVLTSAPALIMASLRAYPTA
jgi:hypothetical protein